MHIGIAFIHIQNTSHDIIRRMEKEATPTFYITRDIERALGVWPLPEHFHIITNRGSFAEEKAKATDRIFLIQEEKVLDTEEILGRADVTAWIKLRSKTQTPHIIVFKNTKRIETICRGLEFNLLNPSAELGQKIEEKISQIEWLGELTSLMPLFDITPLKNIMWADTPFIIQFNHGHTGQGTLLIDTKESLQKLIAEFPDRVVKKSTYCLGPVYTLTSVVCKEKTLVGNANYQITGLSPFTTEPFATIGNDWSFANTSLAPEQKEELRHMAEAIGTRMAQSGWKGAFGIDVLLDIQTGNFLLLEINARQPAGAVFESELQSKERDASNIHEATLIEAHYRALIGGEPAASLVQISNGAQIILRATPTILSKRGSEFVGDLHKKQTALEALGLHMISYRNTRPNCDILRIQSTSALVESHGVLNSTGTKIRDIVSN